MNAAVETIAEVPRDRFSRPLIIPPHGGKPIPYTRCTTYVGALEDTYNLGQWQMRMVAAGVAATPGLPSRLAALGLEPASDPEKKAWKDSITPLIEEAMETAKAKDKARRGTEFHQITENFERTGDLTDVPDEWAPNLDAFIEATKGLKSMAIEQFLVNDEHQVGGTADRVYQIAGVDGYVIGDLKTGNTSYGIGKIAMQLCMYAHSQMYDLATGVRTPIPGLRTDFGIVMDHDIPSATCRLIEVDLRPAWDAIQVAKQVRAWRSFAKPKNLVKPWIAPQIDAIAASLDVAIAQASSREDLSRLWSEAAAAGTWTPTHTAAAHQRLAALESATPAA
ncbi:MAG: hypothetical protein L0L50_02430 [Propionibacterium sp.]|nr:hypothetical protein [Propionibacterium sp.]